MIRVLLVEDDEIFRLGLTVSLRKTDEIDLVASCEDGQSALKLAEELKPELILMDIGLPVMTGIEATQAIKKRIPKIKVLALTSHTEPKIVNQIMDAGADGFCLKGVSTERLLVTIEEVCKGTFWVDAAVSELIRARLHSAKGITNTAIISEATVPDDVFNSLTEREKEILNLIAQGKKNSEIAEICYISLGTVRVHVHSILSKLNVKDRTQAALLARKISPE